MSSEVAPFTKSFRPEISSHGYGDATILFLGGYPTNEDIMSEKALSGSQSVTLDNMLRSQKLDMGMCYSSLFIRQAIGYAGSNPKKLYQALMQVDKEAYLDMLFEEIKSINPNVIVPLDDIALGAVYTHINLIKKPKGRRYFINCYRGSILPLREDWQVRLPSIIRVIPTLSPQLLNQDYTARAYVKTDYKRINACRLMRSVVKEPGLVWCVRNSIELHRFFTRGLASNSGFVTFDIETYGGMITMISFCFDGNEAASVPLSPYYFPEISPGEMGLIWQLVAKLLAHKIPKCNQNIKYDWTILERHGFYVKNVVHDTMLKGALLYPELPKALDFLNSIYTEIPYYKDEGKDFDPRKDNKDKLSLYNAKDALSAHVVNLKQETELIENDQHDLYHKEIAPLLIIYKNMDETGILVDTAQRDKLVAKYMARFERELSLLQSLTGNPDLNIRSWQQLGVLIYEDLRFPKRTKTNEKGEKVYKTDKDTLDDLIINHADNNRKGQVGTLILSKIILIRKIFKVLEMLDTPLYPDNTFRGVSNLGGTETGRSSSSRALDEILLQQEFWKDYPTRRRKLGRSLQTISKHGFHVDDETYDAADDGDIAADLRSIFVPPRGKVFVEGDGNGAEARVVFVLAEDYDSLALMDQKPKIHARTAAFIFNIDVNLIKKDEFEEWQPKVPQLGLAYYDLGKRIQHAGNYDMTEFRLAQMTHIKIKECRYMLDKFHELRPKIRGVFHAEVDAALTKYRVLETPFGRKRQFFDRLSQHSYKEAKAQIPQGTITDLTKFTMSRIVRNYGGYMRTYKFLTEQHDGILSLVNEDCWEAYAEAFKTNYERPISFRRGTLIRDYDLTIPAEISMSRENWMNLKEVKL